jgi:hypothetical protein
MAVTGDKRVLSRIGRWPEWETACRSALGHRGPPGDAHPIPERSSSRNWPSRGNGNKILPHAQLVARWLGMSSHRRSAGVLAQLDSAVHTTSAAPIQGARLEFAAYQHYVRHFVIGPLIPDRDLAVRKKCPESGI